MGISFDFKMEFPNLHERLKRAMPEIKLFVAAQMQFNRGMLFMNSGAYNGHQKWAPLKLRSGQPLKDRGTLSQSLGPISNPKAKGPTRTAGGIVKLSGDTVSIGTNLHYAWLMNWGTTKMPNGKLTAKKKQALKIPVDNGFIFRKSVKIPARRFDNWTREDEKDIRDAIAMKVAQVMKR